MQIPASWRAPASCFHSFLAGDGRDLAAGGPGPFVSTISGGAMLLSVERRHARAYRPSMSRLNHTIPPNPRLVRTPARAAEPPAVSSSDQPSLQRPKQIGGCR
jgi:hypothetical protein